MNKIEFLESLRSGIRVLPQQEIEDVVAYYDEYISDYGDEEEAIKKLQHPRIIASKLLAEFNIKETNENKSTGAKSKTNVTLLAMLIALLSAPIAVPMAIVIFALLFAAVVTVGALIFALVTAGFAVLSAGVMSIPYLFVTSPLNALMIIGFILFSVGAFGLIASVGYKVIVSVVNWVKMSISKMIERRYSNDK